MLSINNLSFAYKNNNNLLNNISLSIPPGHCCFIEGQSGCGKTTLCEILSGSFKSFSGDIYFNDYNIRTIPEKDYYLFFHYLRQKPEENLLGITPDSDFKLWRKGSQSQSVFYNPDFTSISSELCLDDILTLFRLKCKAEAPFWSLSFGQIKAYALTSLVLIPRPLWIMDEPFSGLDKYMSDLLLKMIDLHLKANGSIIIFSHLSNEFNKINTQKFQILNGEIKCTK